MDILPPERQTEIDRNTDRQRERDRNTDRWRERPRQTVRERERQTDWVEFQGISWSLHRSQFFSEPNSIMNLTIFMLISVPKHYKLLERVACWI